MNKCIVLIISFMSLNLHSEDILIKNKKPKTESVSKLKESIASDLEEILSLSTKAIKQLTHVIDDSIVHVKQLAGQESGKLTSTDKKVLEQFQQDICKLKKVLQDLEGQCLLSV